MFRAAIASGLLFLIGITGCSSGNREPSPAPSSEAPAAPINPCLLTSEEMKQATGRTLSPKPAESVPAQYAMRTCRYFGSQDDDAIVTTFVDDRPGGTLWATTKQLAGHSDEVKLVAGVGDEAYTLPGAKFITFRKGRAVVTISLEWAMPDATKLILLRATALKAVGHLP